MFKAFSALVFLLVAGYLASVVYAAFGPVGSAAAVVALALTILWQFNNPPARRR